MSTDGRGCRDVVADGFMLAEGAVSVRRHFVFFCFVRESGHGACVVAAVRTLIDGGVETVRRPCIQVWYIPPLYGHL